LAVVNLKDEFYRRNTGINNRESPQINVKHAEDVDNYIMQVTQKVTQEYSDLVNAVSRGEKDIDILENVVGKTILNMGMALGEETSTDEAVKKVLDSILGYGVLQPYIKDPQITDIFINGPDNIYVRVNGKDVRVPEIRWKDNNHLEQYVRSVLIKCGRKIHSGIPLADARDTRNRLRVNAGIPPVAKTPYMAIRIHTVYHFTLEDFLDNGTFTDEVLKFIKKGVQARLNILIAGPTGSGKTTLLRFVTEEFIQHDQRVVVLEEEEELMLRLPNMVALEAKRKSGEDDTNVEMDDMVKNSLRMAMRRIILGELRGKEAFTLLRAFGTGHDGGLTTVHANDTYNAIEQLAVMMMFAKAPLSYVQLKRIISQSIDLMIYIDNCRVTEITSVDGFDEESAEVILSPVFVTERDKTGKLQCRPCPASKSLEKLFWQRGYSL